MRRSLVDCENALRVQSREHPDGWGVAYYADGHPCPRVVRGVDPAFRDDAFTALCGQVASRTVVAHVRKATVGEVHERNSHPFHHGRWTFAHNGTVEGWHRVREEVERGIGDGLRGILKGETDSERVFLLVLTELRRAGVDLDRPGDSLPAAATVGACARLSESLREVSRRAGSPTPTSLNFVLTDGRVLLAHRLGRDLHYRVESGGAASGSGAGCGTSTGTAGVMLASERPCPKEKWREVPERGVLLVDARLKVRLHRYAAVGIAA